jgi:general secretion pathway protein L
LFSDGTRLLCNCEDTKFSLLPGQHLKLAELGMSKNDIDKLVYCHPEPSSENNLSAYKDELEIEIEQSPIQPYLYLVKNCPAARVNLLQGAYRKKKNWSKAGKAWMPAAAAFLIWLLVEGVMFVADYISLSNQSQKLNEQMVQIYKSTFPGARNISNPRARMESQLLSLKKRKGQNGRGFTEMLSGSAAIFANTPGLKIKTMRYYDGRINLELKVASLQALDKLKLQLINEQGYQVEIQNASSDKENVSARIQITGAAS